MTFPLDPKLKTKARSCRSPSPTAVGYECRCTGIHQSLLPAGHSTIVAGMQRGGSLEPRADAAVSPASGCRPVNASAYPETVEAGVSEVQHLVGDEGGDSTRSGSFRPCWPTSYLNYVFDLWVEVWWKKCASWAGNRGPLLERHRHLWDLGERIRKVELELRPDKTRLVELGRRAERNRKQRGEEN
jgi:hypothetical protein